MAEPETPTSTEHLIKSICDPDNIRETAPCPLGLRTSQGGPIAVQKSAGAERRCVQWCATRARPASTASNKSRVSSKARWPEIEDQLLQGSYQPQPLRRVKIPKPAGGTRNLGIPTVIDRVIQQAVLQRLQPPVGSDIWDVNAGPNSMKAQRQIPEPDRTWNRLNSLICYL